MAQMKRAIAPQVAIEYNGRDISADLAPYLRRTTVVDRLTGEADSLDVELAEHHHSLSRWLAEWYPDKGMEIIARFGYIDRTLTWMGRFEVDEIEVSSPPLAIRLRALATGISKAVRTRQGRAYEDITLATLVDRVAQRMGAKRRGTIADIRLDRVTQYQESDWQFLTRLLREYGYHAKLTDNNTTVAVARLTDLAAAAVRVLRPADMTSWRYRDHITEVPARSEVRHHDAQTGRLVAHQVDAGQLVTHDAVTAADRDQLIVRAKTPEQALARARAIQERHEAERTLLEITLPGDPVLLAGAAVDVRDLARLNGRYVIIEARHEISTQGGYVTTLDLKRLREGTA